MVDKMVSTDFVLSEIQFEMAAPDKELKGEQPEKKTAEKKEKIATKEDKENIAEIKKDASIKKPEEKEKAVEENKVEETDKTTDRKVEAVAEAKEAKADKRRSMSPEKSESKGKSVGEKEEVELREKTVFGDRVKRRSTVEPTVDKEDSEPKGGDQESEFARMVSRFKKTAEQKRIETDKKAAELDLGKKGSKTEIEQKRSSVYETPTSAEAEKRMPRRSQSMAVQSTPANVQVFKRDSPKVKDRERSRTFPQQTDARLASIAVAAAEEEKENVAVSNEKKEGKPTPPKTEIIIKRNENVTPQKPEHKADTPEKEPAKSSIKVKEAVKTEPKKEIVEPKKEVTKAAPKVEQKEEKKKEAAKVEERKSVEIKERESEEKHHKENKAAKKEEFAIKKDESRTKKEVQFTETSKPQTVQPKTVQIRDSDDKSRGSVFKVKTMDSDCSWMTLARRKTQNWNAENGKSDEVRFPKQH
jgi:hypothetical protein